MSEHDAHRDARPADGGARGVDADLGISTEVLRRAAASHPDDEAWDLLHGAANALDETRKALRAVVQALVICKPHLDHPFPDRPTLTPWSLTCERPFVRAAEVMEAHRGH